MSRQRRFDWFTSRPRSEKKATAGSQKTVSPLRRKLGFESLENRRMLSVNFTGSYSQNFDSLSTTGTNLAWANDMTLEGWHLFRQPAPGTAITAINAGDGSSNAGNFFSFGLDADSDRALGGVASGGAYFGGPATNSIAGWIAVSLLNSTGSTITSFTVNYDGEQWRDGGQGTFAPSFQTMVFEYGFGNTFETVAAWNVAGEDFDFTSPISEITTTTGAALNGNDDVNRISGIGGTISDVAWNANDTLWLRWIEKNDPGNDHALAIDNFSISIVSPVNPLIVTTTVDENDGPGVGNGTSLREAIEAAEFGDTITFDPSIFLTPRTITLTQGELIIDKNLTIAGFHHSLLTIDASGSLGSRAFSIISNAGIPTVDLSGMTIRGGSVSGNGGGIYNEGYLTLSSVVVTFNTAFEGGGIYNGVGASLELVGSTIQSNQAAWRGGGISSVGETSIATTLIRLNESGYEGGGIFQQEGTLDITTSLLLQNTSFGNGGAISANLANVSLTGVDVFQNDAWGNGGGIHGMGGGLIIQSSRISGNETLNGTSGTIYTRDGESSGSGGGIWSSGVTMILGSEISGNRTGNGGDGYNDDIDEISGGMFSFGGHAGYGGGLWVSGQTTISHSIISGNSTGSGGNGDAEVIPPYSPYNPDPDPVFLGREGYAGDGGGIYATGHLTITGSQIADNFTGMSGNADGQSISSGNGGGIAMRWMAGNELTLIASIVRDNIAENSGGGIWATGTVTLERSWITGNSAGGVVVMSTDSSAIIRQSTISDNSGNGLSLAGTSSIDSSTISGNSGGGISNFGNSLTISHSTITQNASGVFNNSGFLSSTTTVYSSIIAGNNGTDIAHSTFLPSSSIQSEGYNLIGTGNGANSFNAAGDQVVGTASLGLLPLADNGGFTFPDGSRILTHALSANSPAFGAGDPTFAAPPDFDQRGAGFDRVSGGRIDIGAYETQTIVVDTHLDESDGDYSAGDLSLREAIELANSTSGKLITFAPELTGHTLVLTLGQLPTISTPMSIVGLGETFLTIDASGNDPTPSSNNGDGSRIFNIDDGQSTQIVVTISGLTLTGGDSNSSGGAILSMEDLTLHRVAVVNNRGVTGGGIGSSGNLTIIESSIMGNVSISDGGGIFAADGITLVASTVSGNSAGLSGPGYGGAIFAGGYHSIVSIVSSTISGNNATRGGGLAHYNMFGELTEIRHSTITANSATKGGGIFVADQLVYLSDLILSHSIVAGNNAAQNANIYNSGGPGENVISTFSITSGNPQLGPLADNGGPTMTHAPLLGSPAIDAGDPTILYDSEEYDQRGAPFVRVFDGNEDGTARIDIGAIEWQPFVLEPFELIVSTTSDVVNGDFSPGDLSLREAIQLANHFGNDQTITFDAVLFAAPQTILLTQGELELTKGVAIQGPGSALLTIDAQNASQIFVIDDTFETVAEVEIEGLTLTRGMTPGGGGAIYTKENLKIRDIAITNSVAGFDGGGIASFAPVLTVINGTIVGNSTGINGGVGGGIFHQPVEYEAMLTIESSLISENVSLYGGGGIAADSVTLLGSTVSDNSANGSGGGISAWGDVTLTNSTVSSNSAVGSGGGIDAFGNVTLTQSTVSDNSTEGNHAHGGGIFAIGRLTLSESSVTGNWTVGESSYGGGIYSKGIDSEGDYGGEASDVTLADSTVNGNWTEGYSARGGGIFIRGNLTLTESSITGNWTEGDLAKGGGIYSSDGDYGGEVSEGDGAGELNLINSTVNGNYTTGKYADGGGIFTRGALTLTQSTVSGNSTEGEHADGGGIYSAYGDADGDYGGLVITDSTVTDNHAVHATSLGGGVFQLDQSYDHALAISGSIVAGNTAGGGGNDLVKDPESILTANFSLIGTGITPDAGGNNIVTDNPLLAPLANNGGPTPTHALLPGSPAINAGAPILAIDPEAFDQRGLGFPRVVGGRYDIGAFETATAGRLTTAVAAALGIPVEQMEDLDTGLLVWLDGNDASSFVAGGTTTWLDKSGNNSPATQSNAAGAPVQNGVWIDFTPDTDGAGSDLNDTLTLLLNNAPAGTWTTTLAFQVNANSSDQGILFPGGFSQPGPSLTHHFNLVYGYWGGGGRNLSTAAAVGAPHGVVQAWGGGTMAADKLLWVNGGEVTTGGGVPIENNDLGAPLTLGNASTPLDGRIGTVIIHTGVLSVAARQQLEGYLAAVWGTSLPPDHPYAVEPPSPSGDFDGDGDVDGRDFLLWQRGYGTPAPNATPFDGDADGDQDVDGDDLEIWQGQYGLGTFAALGSPLSALDTPETSNESQEPEIYDLGFMISDWDEHGKANNIETVFKDSYVAEVDRAIEELAMATPSGVRSFGEMVARRPVKRPLGFADATPRG